MSDNIPYEIQMEIIKRVPNVKSLIRFRSVSKSWKSFIDSSEFIAGYGARKKQPHSLLLRYKHSNEDKCVCFVDAEIDTLTRQLQDFSPNVPDLMKKFNDLKVIGSSHGLLCLRRFNKDMLVLWNPSIQKYVGIRLPYLPGRNDFLGFVVCPVSNDPTIILISYADEVAVFTLSSKRWTVFEYTKLPPKPIAVISSQVVTDRCIYWTAYESFPGWIRPNYLIMLYDLIAKEIRVVDIPLSCVMNSPYPVRCFFISKLRESLVLFVPDKAVEIPVCNVWKMDYDETFTKLFTISTPDYTINNILGFRKNGEPVMETQKEDEEFAELEVYEQCSESINNLGIYGEKGSFYMDDSYKETLLLLNHSNGCVYTDNPYEETLQSVDVPSDMYPHAGGA